MHKNIDIYDTSENRIGTLTNGGRAPQFYSMTRTVQSEDNDSKSWQDTLTITIPDEEVNGYNIREYGTLLGCWRPNGRYYLYEVEIVEEDYTQPLPAKKLTCLNLLQYELMGTVLDAKTYSLGTVADIIPTILQRTNWNVGDVDGSLDDNGGAKSFEIAAGDNAMTALSNLLTTFGVALDAYVQELKPGVFKKIVDCKSKLGAMTYQTLDFHTGMTGFTRTVSREPGTFATRIYPKTSDGKGIESINNGIGYVQDVDANAKYNANSYGNFVEMTLTNDTGIGNLYALKDWASEQLKKYATPPYTYTFNTSFVQSVPNLGDGYYFKNFGVEPPLIVEGYVTSVTDSYTNPETNAVTCGDFRTIEYSIPSIVKNLREQLSQQAATVEAVNAAIKDANTITLSVLQPDGTDFATADDQKRLIAQTWENNTNISAFVANNGWRWQSLTDGSTSYGYQKHVTYGELGTWRAQVDNDYISTTPEINVNPRAMTAAFVGSFTPWVNDNPKETGHIAQCIVDMGDGYYITSHGLGKSQKDGTAYVLRDSSLKIVSKMVVDYGGHGTNFGAYKDGNDYYLIIGRHDAAGTTYYLSRVKYQAGKTLAPTASDFLNLTQSSRNMTAGGNASEVSYKIGDTVTVVPWASINTSDKKLDIQKITTNVTTVNLAKSGLTNADYYQSYSVASPFVFWCSGNYNPKLTNSAPNRIAAVNHYHGGQEFRTIFDAETFSPKYSAAYEIQSINRNTAGQVLVMFIAYDGAEVDGRCVEYVYKWTPDVRVDDTTPPTAASEITTDDDESEAS